MALINAEACNTGDRISRFNNYLRNNCLAGQGAVYSSSDYTDLKTVVDAAIIELASKAIARLFQGWPQPVEFLCFGFLHKCSTIRVKCRLSSSDLNY